MLPNVLIIGAMKAGTSSLHRYLASHPRVFMSEPKELNFFVEERNWGRGFEWYEGHFERADGALVVGESSPSYAMHPTFRGVPERAAAVLPATRLIYLVRHPIERIRSQYIATYHLRRAGRQWQHDPIQREHRPIEAAVLDSPDYYLDASLYAMQIERYLQHFTQNQLLVVTSEQLRDERAATLGRIFAFLGLDGPWSAPATRAVFNRTAGKRERRPLARAVETVPGYRSASRLLPEEPKQWLKRRVLTREIDLAVATISPSFRRHLEGLLRDDVRRLSGYLGDGFDGWGIV